MDEDEENKSPIEEPEEEQSQPGDTANDYTNSMDDDEEDEGENEEQKDKKDKKDKDDDDDDNKDDKEHDDENTDDNKDSEDNENDNDENTDNSNDDNENNDENTSNNDDNENSGNSNEAENQKDDNQDDLDTDKKDDKKDDSSDNSKNDNSSNPESPKNQNPQGNNQGGKTPNTTPPQPGGGVAGAGGAEGGAAGAASAEGAAGAAGAGGAAAGAGGTAAAAGGTAAAGTGAAATAVTPVGWVIIGIIAIIVLIIIIVGFISFFITMPGMVIGKIKEFAIGIWDGVQGYFIGAAEANVNNDDIVEMAQYLYDMGYDLESYGFANVDSVEYEDDNKTIKDLESDCIWAYLVAENKTYLISNDNFSWKDALNNGFFSENFRENGPSGAWGSGMIHFEESFLEEIVGSIGDIIGPVGWVVDNLEDLISYIKVDRENNQLVMKRINWDVGLKWPWDWARIDKTYINLEGWTGRYGKPFELLVSLHVATMAPDFVKEIALNEDLDAKVNIDVEKAIFQIDYFVVNNGKDNEEKIDVSDKSKAKDRIKELNKDGVIDDDLADALKDILDDTEIKTYTPYIKSVTNHWFRNVYFDTDGEEKEIADVDENGDYIYTESNGEKVLSTTTKSVDVYGGRNEESEQFTLSNTDDDFLAVGRITKGNVEQLEDAVRGTTNETTKELFNGEYYIYDGTYETAKKIQNGEVDKKPLSFTKDSLNAFSILEQEHTLDAQLIYRDLRELLIELSYFEKEDFEKDAKEELEWPIPSYFPTEWPNREIEKQSTEYGTLIASKPTMDALPEEKRTSTGFEAGSNVIAMGDATVVDFVSLDPYGEGVKLKLTGNTSIKDWTLIILGIDVSDSLKINDTVKSVDIIGTTTTNDILIILRDNELSVVENVEDYIISDNSVSSSSLNLNITGGNAEEKIWNTFINAGYSPISTAAVMGNIYGESSFNPGVEEYSGGGGYGLCQWTGGRRTQLENFARARGVSPSSIDLQIEFLLAEITGSGADGYASYQFGGHENDKQTWLTSSSIADATTAFCAGFERPGNPRNQVRIEAAERYYDLYSK